MKPNDNKKEKIKEPYSPTNTPNPPQDIDPSRPPEKEKNNISDSKKKTKEDAKVSQANSQKNSKTKKSGESETEIDDGTTH
jgi:hypothetical protein